MFVKLQATAKKVNGLETEEEMTKEARIMCIGYLIANTSLELDVIGRGLDYAGSDSYTYSLFQEHRAARDGDAAYRKRYHSLCLRMGTMNKL